MESPLNPSDTHPRMPHAVRRHAPIGIAFVLLAVGFFSGCGGSDRPKLAPVRGRVLYHDQPVVGATVTFMCENAPCFASGTTDAEGNYTLSSYEPNDGAVVGLNVVTVSKPLMPPDDITADSPLSEDYVRAMASSEQTPVEGPSFPARYADPRTSDLTVEVTSEGSSEHNLRLED